MKKGLGAFLLLWSFSAQSTPTPGTQEENLLARNEILVSFDCSDPKEIQAHVMVRHPNGDLLVEGSEFPFIPIESHWRVAPPRQEERFWIYEARGSWPLDWKGKDSHTVESGVYRLELSRKKEKSWIHRCALSVKVWDEMLVGDGRSVFPEETSDALSDLGTLFKVFENQEEAKEEIDQVGKEIGKGVEAIRRLATQYLPLANSILTMEVRYPGELLETSATQRAPETQTVRHAFRSTDCFDGVSLTVQSKSASSLPPWVGLAAVFLSCGLVLGFLLAYAMARRNLSRANTQPTERPGP